MLRISVVFLCPFIAALGNVAPAVHHEKVAANLTASNRNNSGEFKVPTRAHQASLRRQSRPLLASLKADVADAELNVATLPLSSLSVDSQIAEHHALQLGHWLERKEAAIAAVFAVLAGLLFVAAFASVVLYYATGYLLGRSVRSSLESMDEEGLGVGVEVRELTVNPYNGLLEITDLKVKNPPGYLANYLLRSGKIVINFDMFSVWTSLASEVLVTKLEIRDVDVIVEKDASSPGGGAFSNVHDVLSFIKVRKKAISLQTPPTSPHATAEEVGDDEEPKKIAASDGKLQVLLGKVEVCDIGVKLSLDALGGLGMRFALGDIMYADFQKDHGKVVVEHIVLLLLDTVLKTVLTNVIAQGEDDGCCSVAVGLEKQRRAAVSNLSSNEVCCAGVLSPSKKSSGSSPTVPASAPTLAAGVSS